MARHFLNTRPREDAEPLTALLAARGHAVTPAPLLTIDYVTPADLDLGGVAGLLATSANGVRAFARACAERELALYAVGDATAMAAREAGFAEVYSASGDVAALADLVIERLDPAGGALLHAAGTRVAGDLGGQLAKAGFEVRRVALYRADKARALPAAARLALDARAIDGVLIFSPRTARSFATLVRRAGLEASLGGADLFCLSAAVAAQAESLDWRQIYVAERPEQAALLSLIDQAPE
jgi:uroporphyrinogen-III synthase